MKELLLIIKFLPELIGLVKEIIAFINKITGGKDPVEFAKETKASFVKLNSAQSEQEINDAAKEVAAIFSAIKL